MAAPQTGGGSSRRGAAIFSAIVLGAAAVVGLVLLFSGGEDDAGGTSAGVDDGSDGCAEVSAPAPKDVKLKEPSGDAADVVATVRTSCGSFTIDLDAEASPKTTASFEHMAREGLYDGTMIHRVAPGFVIQGGDPLGDGTGGPGYSVDERPPSDTAYTRGIVAMAKSPAEPPGRSGSQFFVVTGADAGLPPDYAVLGEVDEGFETIERIEALGVPGSDGPPSETVVIESVSIEPA